MHNFRTLLNQGSERTVKAKKNIFAMFLLKGGSIVITLLLVPLTLNYVDSDTYGIWVAISTMVTWIGFFDIGLGNGLKNKLAESLAVKNYELARKYVSTTYVLLTLLFIPLMFALAFLTPLINWTCLLNLPITSADGIQTTILITICYFCINFILSTINTIMLAEQRPADAALRTFIQQLAALIAIFVLTKTTEGSLIKLCLALCGTQIIVVAFFNFIMFVGRYKNISPALSYTDFSLTNDLLKLGAQFFIIQIAAMIIFQMTSFLILRYFGGSSVALYDVNQKYFNALMMVWNILTTPLWVAYTDAITKHDYEWIERSLNKYLKLLLAFVAVGFFMLTVSKFIIHLWVGDKVVYDFMLSFWVLVFNITSMITSLYVSFINGSGELKIQTISSIFAPVIFLIVCFWLMRMGVGISSIIIASVIANFNGIIIAPIQTRYLLKKMKLKDNVI